MFHGLPERFTLAYMIRHCLIICTLLCTLGATTGFSDVLITEFVAENDESYLDKDGDASDWIEIHNDSSSAVDLSGWSLTDDSGDLTKWIFPPGTTLGPRAYRVIFASGKNRRTFDREFHTNFSLKKSGEYLAIVRNDGVTVEHSYGTTFPPQYPGMSYGLDQDANTATVIAQGATGQAGVPASQADFTANYANWNLDRNMSFTEGSWQNVTTGVGYETTSGYGSWLGTDLETEMNGVNASVFLRVPFTVPDATAFSSLVMRMRWDDGFVAYINGVQVAADRNPATLQWNSSATANRNDGLNDEWATFTIPVDGLGLVNGTNILAIHGLNQNSTSSDMLILPELDLHLPGAPSATAAYQLSPSPGAGNGMGITDVPPYFANVTDQVDRPTGGIGSPAIVVTADVRKTEDDITSVKAFQRVMFGSEVQVNMNDSGTGADEVAGDSIYSAFIPTTGMGPGQMLRWRFEAQDASGGVANAPLYPDPIDSARYYGTVAQNSAHSSSQLPILETFVQDETAVNTRGGTRACVYYLGEFYDNIQMDLHGQSTAGFPKKSYDLDFNKGSRFRWKSDEQRVKDINLLTNWADKSKSRNALAYEFLKHCGAAYHFAFPVRVERNGAFFSTADMVEDGDDRFLERIGLDGNGSLYKMYDRLINPNQASKKTRKEEGNEDIAALIAGINDALPRDTRRLYAYDNVDLAASVNYLASLVVVGISDNGHKNYYVYRDTEGSGEWRPLPWDVDLSAGRRFNSTDRYFDDTFFNNLWVRNPNRLWELIHNTPEYRDMYLRRIRTLIDDVLLAPGTSYANDWYSQKANEWADLLDPAGVTSDADLDYAKWGSWGNNNEVRPASTRIINEWLPAKRSYLFDPARSYSGETIPPTQSATPNITLETVDFLPASGNQEEEYLVLKNGEATAIDISGWALDNAIDYTFPPGTVIPPGDGSAANDYIGLFHVAKNSSALRAGSGTVTGGQFRFIQGNYKGQLSARGETIELRNSEGTLVTTQTYIGTPTAAQEHLRITEIMYHPTENSAISPDPQDFEFIELRNISSTETIDLTGIKFTGGIAFDFTGSAVTSLLPGEYVLVVANELAFTNVHGTSLPVAGGFFGSLNNGGEPLRLEDSVGEKILEFAFKDSWHPLSDGLGFSLAIENENADWTTWGEKDSWRLSGLEGGTPGTSVTPTITATILVNEVLAHTDLPQVDSIELHNPGTYPADIGGWFLTDDFLTPKKFRIPDNTIIPAGDFIVFDESDFSQGPNSFRLSEYGEAAYLFSGDPGNKLTGYYHGENFQASPNGISLGSHVDSQGIAHFVLQKTNSLNAANSAPLVGPVVMSEIHYHPVDLPGGVDNPLDEFIELTNTSNATVPLYSTYTNVPGYGTNALNDTWRLRNAVDFDFPPGVEMEPGESILVVSFDPVTDTAQLLTFRSTFNVPPEIGIYGPWSGKLSNDGEELELKYPGSADPLLSFYVPYYTAEEIDYRDTSPWPTPADGSGPSLQRLRLNQFANDPTNWGAASPAPGAGRDADADGMEDWWETLHGLTIGVNDSGFDPDLDGFTNLQEFLARTSPFDPSNFLELSMTRTLSVTNLSFTASSNVSYTIQYTDSLTHPDWKTFQTIPAQPQGRPIEFSYDPTESQRFFRVITRSPRSQN
jgi:hypothetical protein